MGAFVGQQKVLLDICPESSKLPSYSTGAAPDVAPLSKMPVFPARLFSTLRAQCAATLLPGHVSVTTDIIMAMLVRSSLIPISSCSSTRQVSGDQ